MANPIRELKNLDWVGGHPALDFVNTVHAWAAPVHEDYLNNYNDLLAWNQMAGLIGPEGVRALGAGNDSPRTAALAEAQRLRESLHAIFRAAARSEEVPDEALQHLNAMIRTTVRWRRFTAAGARLRCGWSFSGAPPYALLGPVTWQAAELLEHGPLDRIKECPPPEGCGWLFLDTSKNRSRTWCSMKTCGNAAKVRRYRRRREKMED